jgi:heat-inducible transcriptional repressor
MTEHKTTLAPVQPLTQRAAQVLADVVETYGAEGEPVGSKALVDSGKYQLSGASIRNVMQDLEAAGLLMSPHTSAGRIPTEDGFRYYAQNLVQVGEPSDKLKKELAAQLSPSKSLSTVMKDLSGTISTLTGCATLVSTPPRDHDMLEQMDFIRLSGDRVLVVMVTKTGEIENRIIEVPGFVSAEDLQKAAKTLRPVLTGQTLEQARANLVNALSDQKMAVNAMIDQMMNAAQQWGEPVTADGAMMIAGSNQLFQYPELVREQLQKLVKLFEEKRMLMALVEEVRKGSGVKIFVGRDVPVQGAGDVAVIASPFGKQDTGKASGLGTIGVIGPLRMNYKNTLSVVNYTSQLLTKLVSES